MKALVLAERSDAARSLCAGARTIADEVVFVAIGSVDVPAGIADKVAHIALPESAVFDDAAETVISVFDAEAPGVVFVEPTRHLLAIAGKLAAHCGTATITDVLAFEDGAAKSLYFGGVGERTLKVEGTAIYTVSVDAFGEAAPSGANATEEISWVAPACPLKLVSSKPIEKSGVDLFKAEAV
ncbi:MAG: electron transfer flavoprotein subunit alpha/FixB family protein, partial [Raoultibacter sp.]